MDAPVAAAAVAAMKSSLPNSAAVVGGGPLVVPGKYTVSLAKRVEGVVTPLPGSQTVEVVAEGPSTKEDRVAMAEFQEKLAKLQKALTATTRPPPKRARGSAPSAAPSTPPPPASKLREEALKLQSN